MFKKMKTIALALCAAVAFAIPAFAASPDPASFNDALSDGLNAMQTDLWGMIGIALPIALGIFALFFGIRKVIKFIRGV